MTPTKEEFVNRILEEQEKRKKARLKAKRQETHIVCSYIKERRTDSLRRKRNSRLRGAALQ